jgi:NADH-quinone oxidoreductase subunit C
MLPDTLKQFPDVQALESHLPGAIQGGKHDRGELTLDIAAAKIVPACDCLRSHRGYDLLSDLTCFDGYPVEPRFQIVYHLFSVSEHRYLRLKAHLPGAGPRVETVSTVWPAAGWFEREVFDLFGIHFTGHTDLRRILLPETFEGHPLRKDYPVEGPR